MCGIVGIYLKSKKFEKSLGKMLSKMLVSMESRGPDSAGFAIYNSDKNKIYKYSVCLNEMSFEKFKKEIKKKVKFTTIEKNSDHVILKSIEKPNKILPTLEDFSTISLVGYGKSIKIFKQVGNPRTVVKKFNLDSFSGTHGIGHTRMATESAITTDGSHPYSTGEDECLVHNGSLSNHNNLRRKLKKRNLKQTLNKGLNDLDGFYTFIAGTHSGFAVLRDEIACKPAVIAETKDYVAISSEFQAMAHLPNVNNAKIFEPEPGIVYSWGK